MATDKPVRKPAQKAAKAPRATVLTKEAEMTNEALTKSLEAVAPAVEKATTEFLAQTHAAHEQASTKVRELMEKNMKTMTDMTDFAKGHVEALIESAVALGLDDEAAFHLKRYRIAYPRDYARWSAAGRRFTPASESP